MHFHGRFIITAFVIFVWLFYECLPSDTGTTVEHETREEWEETIRMRELEVNESIHCQEYLNKLQSSLTVKVLLVDSEVLEFVGKAKCAKLNGYQKRIKVATNSRKDFLSIDQKIFEPMYFESDEKKDYLKFDTKPIKIIPANFPRQMIGNLSVPEKPFMFREFWKKSVFMKCLNLTMNRTVTEPNFDAQQAFTNLSVLRDLLIDYDMLPMISEGTLLGWYRECTLIPHTNDMDVNVFVGEFNPILFNEMKEGKTPFRMHRRLGKLETGLEFTAVSREGDGIDIDIFLLYEAKNETSNEKYNWISGLRENGLRIRMTTPLYGAVCALDLHGHIFWATCDPVKAIEHQFGEGWQKDLHTNDYNWDKTRNVIEMGWYSRAEMSTVFFDEK